MFCKVFEHLSAMGVEIWIRSVCSKDLQSSKIRLGGGECNGPILWQLMHLFQDQVVIINPCGPMLGLVFPPRNGRSAISGSAFSCLQLAVLQRSFKTCCNHPGSRIFLMSEENSRLPNEWVKLLVEFTLKYNFDSKVVFKIIYLTVQSSFLIKTQKRHNSCLLACISLAREDNIGTVSFFLFLSSCFFH